MTDTHDDRPTVLIAEDEPLASMALRAQLEALEYRVLGAARDGAEAVLLGSCFPIDLGLFDLRMPVMTGLDAAHQLFRAAPTPVVLLTGFGAADLPNPMPRPPIFATLSKPIGLGDLRTGLTRAYSGFIDWYENDDARAHRVRRAREERRTIGRAVDRLAADTSTLVAAARIVERAREQHRDLIDVANDVLQESPG